jgi:hypothetical protein
MTAMRYVRLCATLLCAGQFLVGARHRACAEDLPAEYRAAVHKGLEWVARTQNPDGSWAAAGGQYPTAMTALAGMVLLMEGSTIRDGQYARSTRKAVEWLAERAQRDTGLIGNPRNPSEASKYLYGHGYGLLFLASV